MKNCDSKKCSNKVANTVRVWYNSIEQDAFYLCAECTKLINKEAISNKWQIKIREYPQSKE
jgi:hypothetical protein